MYRKKNIVMIVMMTAVLFMAVGYALFSSTLNISGISDLTGSWDIKISSVTYEATGKAYNITEPVYTNTTVKFNVGVKVPGDKMTFTVVVVNNGNIDAMLESIDANVEGTDVINYSINGIQVDEVLKAGESKTFTVITEFDIDATQIPSDPVKDLTVKLNYIQDDDEDKTPTDPDINDNTTTITQLILKDNIAQSDASIDFSQGSATDGTLGLYYTSTNTEDNKTTYYFRGNVTNNYVEFAGFFWRIVRINEDGSVRLIYQGKTADATYKNATIGGGAFNTDSYDNAHVGYMYGESFASSYAETHTNTHDSTIKKHIDAWYEKNLKENYSNYLVDAGFCGDREPTDGTENLSGDASVVYKAYDRINNNTPQFKCTQTNDLYTTSTSSKGNRALDYPIGLLTTDELMYSGMTGSYSDQNSYLWDVIFWTMTPQYSDYGAATVGIVINGSVNFGLASTTYGAGTDLGYRPVINIKGDTIVTKGNGTINNPYSITTQEDHTTLVEAILNDNNEQSDTTIDISKPSSYTPYTESHATSTSSVTFTATAAYAFGSSYTFDEATGQYKLAGNITYSTWQSVSRYSYPYTCKYTNASSTCSTLYKMSSYTSTTAGTGYAYTRTAGTTSKTNGQGLYYTSTNTENNKITYYFRGAVTNNYVKFGTRTTGTCTYNGEDVYYFETSFNNYSASLETNASKRGISEDQCLSTNVCEVDGKYVVGADESECTNSSFGFSGTYLSDKATYTEYTADIIWRVVRINEDGSVRLITQDSVAISSFSNSGSSNADVGYMYGTAGATTYEETHANINDSKAKIYLDNWYDENLNSYSSIIADAGFCGDRQVASGNGIGYGYDGSGYIDTEYAATARISASPQFICTNASNDLYTLTTSSKGNKALTKPIGLITADELKYAGSYINNGTKFISMTPAAYTESFPSTSVYGMDAVGLLDWFGPYEETHLGVPSIRPVINVKGNAEVTGTGTSTDPYVINVD